MPRVGRVAAGRPVAHRFVSARDPDHLVIFELEGDEVVVVRIERQGQAYPESPRVGPRRLAAPGWQALELRAAEG